MPHRVLRFVAPDEELRAGLDKIRTELEIPEEYPPEAEKEAEQPPRLPETDLTDIPFVTLDPPGSRDLDQAIHLERTTNGFMLRYAVADVAAFVTPGGALDRETRVRAVTLYAPDKRTPLHPFSLSEGAGSLLAGEDRPAAVWELSFDLTGEIESALVRRAMVRSRAQLDYQSTQAAFDAGNPAEPLSALAELGPLRIEREAARGGVSLPVPEQRVVPADGGWRLEFREVPDVERWNAQLSLATGMAAGRMMAEAGVGVLRTLAPAPDRDVTRLRHAAKALGVDWPENLGYPGFIRSLDAAVPAEAAALAEAAGLFRGAGYQVIGPKQPPRPHAAVASLYAHVTAPLRRLVDRYAAETCLAIQAGTEPAEWVLHGMTGVPDIMARGTGRASRYAVECLDLVEAAVLKDRVGEVFDGVVVDYDAATAVGRVQLAAPAVHARIEGGGLVEGTTISTKLLAASIRDRIVLFAAA
jgi:exoribonuclease R